MTTRTVYFGGAPYLQGTMLPNNVMGECGHLHRSPDTAQQCIDKANKRLKKQIGMANCYVDRHVMQQEQVKVEGSWRVISGSTKPYSVWE